MSYFPDTFPRLARLARVLTPLGGDIMFYQETSMGHPAARPNRGSINLINRLELLAISAKIDLPEGIRLSLAGKMTANGIGDLRREIDNARRHRRTVILDMTEVTLLDRVSAEYLNSIAGPGLRLENCPAYLRRWISGR